jgi:hypothetical protein
LQRQQGSGRLAFQPSAANSTTLGKRKADVDLTLDERQSKMPRFKPHDIVDLTQDGYGMNPEAEFNSHGTPGGELRYDDDDDVIFDD